MMGSKVILVLEDEPLLLQAISKKLTGEGFDVVTATGGQQALDYLKELPKLPDLIWLDYYMKDMNGLDFMHTVHENPQWKDIPVIVVSNSASEENVHSMLALGVSKYILKAQYRLEQIVDMAKEFITGTNHI